MAPKCKFLSSNVLNEKYKAIASYLKQIRDFLLEENVVKRYANTINIPPKLDKSYKDNYRDFYKLRLSTKLADKYFDKLFELSRNFDKEKSAEYKDVEKMMSELREISSKCQGKVSNHYSFSTKLIHTINHHFPIYDQEVGKFYLYIEGCKTRPSMSPPKFESFYNSLIDEYKRIKKDGCLKEVIEFLNSEINGFKRISFEKKIDFIIWRYQTIVDNEIKKKHNST